MRKTIQIFFLSLLLATLAGQSDSLVASLSEILDSRVPDNFLTKVLTDSRLKTHNAIVARFATPYENLPPEKYMALLVTEKRIKDGIAFHNKERERVHAVARQYGVDEYLLIAIVGIESNYGDHHGEFAVVNALYTQAMAMPKRKKWATKQLAEFLAFCYEDSIDPFTIAGSYAGAFGYGQFIPTSFSAYAVDADSDGIRDPYGWADALGSVANYLKRNGYDSSSGSFREKGKNWKAVYAYNHSDNYVNAVIDLRNAIKKGVER